MVDNEVKDDTHTTCMSLIDQPLEIFECAVWSIYVFIVADIISHVNLRTVVHRTNPDYVNTNRADVVQLRDDTLEVSYTIAIGVLKGSGVDLIDDTILPPGSLCDSHVRYVL